MIYRQNSPEASYICRTESQALILPVILQHFEEFRRIPSCRHLARMFGWASHNNAAELIRTLVKDGLLVKLDTPGGRPLLVPVGVKVKNLRAKKSKKAKRLTDGTV